MIVSLVNRNSVVLYLLFSCKNFGYKRETPDCSRVFAVFSLPDGTLHVVVALILIQSTMDVNTCSVRKTLNVLDASMSGNQHSNSCDEGEDRQGNKLEGRSHLTLVSYCFVSLQFNLLHSSQTTSLNLCSKRKDRIYSE